MSLPKQKKTNIITEEEKVEQISIECRKNSKAIKNIEDVRAWVYFKQLRIWDEEEFNEYCIIIYVKLNV